MTGGGRGFCTGYDQSMGYPSFAVGPSVPRVYGPSANRPDGRKGLGVCPSLPSGGAA